MSLFDQIKHAFHPVERAVKGFNAEHVAHTFADVIEAPVKKRIPAHLSFSEGSEVLKIAEPSFIKLDVFADFEVDLGVVFGVHLGMGLVVNHPIRVAGHIHNLVSDPPVTVHNLCDRLWQIAPAEVHVQESVTAVFGETGEIGWNGDDVMQHVVAYITKKGWLEKRLRP